MTDKRDYIWLSLIFVAILIFVSVYYHEVGGLDPLMLCAGITSMYCLFSSLLTIFTKFTND